MLVVAFSSRARRALQHSVRGQKLQWATLATTSKDLPYRESDTPHHTHTHTTHTVLPGKHIHIFMRSQKGVQKATGKREKMTFDLQKKKKNVYNSREREEV